MRVLHIVSSAARSGVTSNIKLLALGLRSRGVESALAHYGLDVGVAPELRALGLPVYRASSPEFLPWALRSRWTVRRLRGALRSFAPDLVHAHSWDADLVACRAVAGTHVPVLASVQSFSFVDWVRSREAQYRRLAAPLRRLVAVSGALKTAVEGAPALKGKPVDMVFNAVDDRFFAPLTPAERGAARLRLAIADGEMAVVCVANFHRVKGQEVLAEAFEALCSARRDARLILVGGPMDPGFYGEVGSMIARGAAGDRAGVVPDSTDSRPVLAAADLYVQPSHVEAMGLAIGEAMACGLPVVATAVGGIPELVSERTGILVPPKDPEAMRRAIESLLDSRDARGRLGAAGADFARENLSAAASLSAHERIYADCLRPGSSTP